ncbi:hypothetical protein HQ48_05715 [Porphyromonas sp. COT-290 OH3588]|nr:hypothetical protein HQ48_05715 [Porphyromonas sp. COT-290 OH3588]
MPCADEKAWRIYLCVCFLAFCIWSVLGGDLCWAEEKCSNEVQRRVELAKGQIRGLHIFAQALICFPINNLKNERKYKSCPLLRCLIFGLES